MANAALNQATPAPQATQPQLRVVQQPQLLSPLPGIRELTRGTLGVVEGQQGSWGHVVLGTGFRAAVIGATFYAFGERDWTRLAIGAVTASAATTILCLAGHAILKRT